MNTLETIQDLDWISPSELFKKKKQLENKIYSYKEKYLEYLNDCNRAQKANDLQNLTTEKQYYDMLFEIDGHFNLNIWNDLQAIKSVIDYKNKLNEFKRVIEIFQNEELK